MLTTVMGQHSQFPPVLAYAILMLALVTVVTTTNTATETFTAGYNTCSGIELAGAGDNSVNGCYTCIDDNATYDGKPLYTLQSKKDNTLVGTSLFCYQSIWRIGTPGIIAKYSASCASENPPSARSFSPFAKGVAQPGPQVSANERSLLSPACPPASPTPAPIPPLPKKNCTVKVCTDIWGPSGCPDLYSVPADLVRPPMQKNTSPGPGKRVQETEPSYTGTAAYHALYLPTDWSSEAVTNGTRYPLIVEFMGNGPWTDGEDKSTGRPEDSNLGYGMSGGQRFIWISMPFLTSNMGPNTNVSTYWWGCPSVAAQKSCGSEYNITPTVDYTKKTVALAISKYGADPKNVILAGWSRGAIACGAIGLHDDDIAKLWSAFMPYSHCESIVQDKFRCSHHLAYFALVFWCSVDGDCGWVDQFSRAALVERFDRLAGRPQLVIGECNVATDGGSFWINHLGVNNTGNFTYATTGFHNHNDAWVLRPGKGRSFMRNWLESVLR